MTDCLHCAIVAAIRAHYREQQKAAAGDALLYPLQEIAGALGQVMAEVLVSDFPAIPSNTTVFNEYMLRSTPLFEKNGTAFPQVAKQ